MTYNREKEVILPASKSIAARYLAATFFAGTLPADRVFDDSEDLDALQQALLALYTDEEPIDYGGSPLDISSSGTAFRFITAICASTPDADFVVTGSPWVCRRPMQPLIDVLREAGADIEPRGAESLGPYRVRGKRLEGGEFSIRGDVSSQFISALMLASPSWKKGMKLNFVGKMVSWPYIKMTAEVMKAFGVAPDLRETYVETVPGEYRDPGNFKIEADWSAATFFFEAAALGEMEISLAQLSAPDKSMQGDARADEIFRKLGVVADYGEEGATLHYDSGERVDEIERDMADMPDVVLPLAVACALSGVRFRMTGVHHLRMKESDRIESLKAGLAKLGYVLKTDDDSIAWRGERRERGEREASEDRREAGDEAIATFDDHRVAMAFAMAALKTGRIKIKNPEVVEKSFADFWNRLPQIGLACTFENDLVIVEKEKL